MEKNDNKIIGLVGLNTTMGITFLLHLCSKINYNETFFREPQMASMISDMGLGEEHVFDILYNPNKEQKSRVKHNRIDNELECFTSLLYKYYSSAVEGEEIIDYYSIDYPNIPELHREQKVRIPFHNDGPFCRDLHNYLGINSDATSFDELTLEEQEIVWRNFNAAVIFYKEFVKNPESKFRSLLGYEKLSKEIIKKSNDLISYADVEIAKIRLRMKDDNVILKYALRELAEYYEKECEVALQKIDPDTIRAKSFANMKMTISQLKNNCASNNISSLGITEGLKTVGTIRSIDYLHAFYSRYVNTSVTSPENASVDDESFVKKINALLGVEEESEFINLSPSNQIIIYNALQATLSKLKALWLVDLSNDTTYTIKIEDGKYYIVSANSIKYEYNQKLSDIEENLSKLEKNIDLERNSEDTDVKRPYDKK